MSLNFVLALGSLVVLLALHLSRSRGTHFSRAFWGYLLAFALALGAGAVFGNASFIVSLAGIAVVLAITNRAPRLADPRERDALRQRATVDLAAARRLRRILEADVKAHRAMREGFLPSVAPEERAQARAMIEQRERETERELEQLDDNIQRLQLDKGAA